MLHADKRVEGGEDEQGCKAGRPLPLPLSPRKPSGLLAQAEEAPRTSNHDLSHIVGGSARARPLLVATVGHGLSSGADFTCAAERDSPSSHPSVALCSLGQRRARPCPGSQAGMLP